MTPLNEDILVRARIILFDNIKQKYLLRLIDHGKPVWRNAKDIYEMKSEKDKLRKYPWQAIPIVLQGIEPENGVSENILFFFAKNLFYRKNGQKQKFISLPMHCLNFHHIL